MIGNKYFNLFCQDSVDKQWKIEYNGGIITNVELFSQSIEISESLCSETELRFGCCEASSLKFKVANIVKPLINDWLTVSVVLDHQESEPMVIGRYKVASDKPTSDRLHREIVAYDAMYEIINANMIDWYNKILPSSNSKVTMRQFRTSFIEYFGLRQKDITLVNDDMIIEKTIQVAENVEIDTETEQTSILQGASLSGLNVISAICEINGCFGHIGRDGNFHYIYLSQAIEGLYPADDLFPDHAPEWMVQAKTGHLYPQDPKGTKIGTGSYIECHYEDFHTKPITKLQIRQEENDIGKIWPEGDVLESDNCYIIQDNFLVYGKSSEQLAVIAENILSKITDIVYRPFDADCVGNPCLEVGDSVRIPTKYEIIESYILKRTMKGVQALRDDYSAEGEEKYSEKINSVSQSIIQLKGKTNILERTVEKTRSEIIDVEGGLRSEILQKAEEIRAEVENTKEGLQSSISQTARDITSTVSSSMQKYDTRGIDVSLYGYISPPEGEIPYDANENQDKYYLDQSTGRLYRSRVIRPPLYEWDPAGELELITDNLSSEIKQTAESITQTVAGSERIWNVVEDDGSTKIDIDLYGYGSPEFVKEEDYNYGMKYLDQETGMVWEAIGNYPLAKPPYTAWRNYRQLELITVSLESKIEQTVKSISLSVDNEKTSATLILSVTGLDGSLIEAKANEIKFTGLVSFEDLSTSGKTIIDGGNIIADSIDVSKINVSTLYLENELRLRRTDSDGTVRQRVALWMEDVEGQTTPNVVVGSADSRSNVVINNNFDVGGETHFEKKVYMDKNLDVEGEIDTDHIYCGTSGVRRGIQAEGKDDEHWLISIEADDVTTRVGFPSNAIYPTTTLLRGNTVKLSSAGSVTTSDERLKNSFKPLDEFDEVYMDIEPCAFKYNNGTSGRYHFGAKAGNVKEAFEKHGYTTKDFGGFVQMSDNPENEDYCGVDDPMGLIYTEFTMWNMHEIQKLRKKVEGQASEIESLKKQVAFLLERM